MILDIPAGCGGAILESVTGFDGSVSSVFEVMGAFCWFEGSDEMADMTPCLFDGSLLCDTHPVLDLGECLLDRIEIGRIRGQIPEPRPGGADELADGNRLVGPEIVHDDDVTWFENSLNNWIEQDHRRIKRRVRPMKGFKSFASAAVTLPGVEMVHMMRKRQGRVAFNPAPSLKEQFEAIAA